MMYDRISGQDWLLRGEATASRFSAFQRVEGEVFVSGDYESATDNLNQDVSKYILECALRTATRVPTKIKEYALRSLRATVSYADLPEVQQERGQLMGNLLSFPLLCLNNFLAFRFLVPRADVPVKINGDDIVFRCRPDEWERWADGVQRLGLKLSRGKTLVKPNFFSLNSAFFFACSRGGKVRDVPVVRASMIVPKLGIPPGPESFVKFLRGWKGRSRTILGGYFLQSHKKALSATGRSIEAQGFPAHRGQVCASGMADRERFLRPLPVHKAAGDGETPLPSVRLRGGVTGTPPGWRQVAATEVGGGAQRLFRDRYRRDAYRHSWLIDCTPDIDDWWRRVKHGGSCEHAWVWFRKSRASRLLIKAARGPSLLALLPPLTDTSISVRKRMVWVPDDFVGRATRKGWIFSGVEA
jgi:hypothetical protein